MMKSPHCPRVTSQTTKHIGTTATALQHHSTSGQTLGLVEVFLWVVSPVVGKVVGRWYSLSKPLPQDP